MKFKLQFSNLKHKLGWLFCLAALFFASQGTWAVDKDIRMTGDAKFDGSSPTWTPTPAEKFKLTEKVGNIYYKDFDVEANVCKVVEYNTNWNWDLGKGAGNYDFKEYASGDGRYTIAACATCSKQGCDMSAQLVSTKYTYANVFLDVSSFSNWKNEGATFVIYAYISGGADGNYLLETISLTETSSGSNIYIGTITTEAPVYTLKATRRSSDGSADWNSVTIKGWSSDYNAIKITDWNAGEKSYVSSCTPPTVTTGSTLTEISTTGVTISGSSYTGGTNVTDVGYVYGTSASPTENETSCGGTSFSSVTISGLTSGETYYYRAYVKDDCGTTYGSDETFSTGYRCYDGKEYMYFDVSACSWFLDDSCVPSISFNGYNESSYIDAALETSGIYKVLVPSGCYSSMYVSRHNSGRYNKYECTLKDVSTHNEFIVDSNWAGVFSWGDYGGCIEPTAYDISPATASFCAGGGTTVSLAGSQSGYTYKLYKDGVATSTTKTGSGSALEFTVNAAGTYTIKGYKSDDETCTADMTGSSVVSQLPNMALTSITLEPASACVGGTSTITPNGYVDAGGNITYTSGTTAVATVNGTTITAVKAGTSVITATVSGGCGSEVSKTATFTVNGADLSVSPTSVSTNPYTSTSLTVTSDADIKWATTTGYLLTSDNTAYVAETAATSVKIKPGTTSGNVTATATSGGCDTVVNIPVSVTTDTQTCQ